MVLAIAGLVLGFAADRLATRWPEHDEEFLAGRRIGWRTAVCALFINEFVTKPWVHLDIAGTGYFRRITPYSPRGATGVSHATLVELALAGAKG